jgi:hypothetical protein
MSQMTTIGVRKKNATENRGSHEARNRLHERLRSFVTGCHNSVTLGSGKLDDCQKSAAPFARKGRRSQALKRPTIELTERSMDGSGSTLFEAATEYWRDAAQRRPFMETLNERGNTYIAQSARQSRMF